ncbi:MAG: hypothetical protein JXK07_10070 [Spirochaetes bacterium]|nr:hypothetical protein [Spirochaetota bacterium]MBN2771256.1 hypothetical protein [Spirochaetota bacterium]
MDIGTTLQIIGIGVTVLNGLFIPLFIWIIRSIFAHDKRVSTNENTLKEHIKNIACHETRLDEIDRKQFALESASKRIEHLEKTFSCHERKLARNIAKLDRNVSLILEKMKIKPAKSLLGEDDE